ncbi:retrovirus-related pol polyprotein from transposon TNT 1-94 [Tanacetum coccineum]
MKRIRLSLLMSTQGTPGCPVYIHNHKDHLGKFDEKAYDDYLLRYLLVSKSFRVFNTRRQQIEETYHITFNESPEAIKFSKPLVDNINIAETKRYPPDEYLHPYEPSQRYQTKSNDVSFIEPHECPEPVVIETEVLSDQNGHLDQNDEILNDDHSEHSNHTNDKQIIDNIPNTIDIQIYEHLSSPSVEDTSAQNNIPIPLPLPIPSVERLVAQGYNQQEGIDYDETFAPVARLEAIRNFLAFATYMNFIVYQMDIKSAFLNGKVKEEVYVKQPPGFESNEFPNHVYKLDKALYGLRQAPRAWYETLSTFLTKHKFVRVKTLMVPHNNLRPDLNDKAINETQYRGMIGSLMYLTVTRPYIQFSTCLFARYQANPKESHLIAVKRIFRKSTSGACQLLGGKLVCWSAKKKQYVAISLAKAEYVAAPSCCANILWMKSQLTDYDIIYEKVPIFCDNTSAIAISNNPVLHSRTKHIDIRYHFIRDQFLKGTLNYISFPLNINLLISSPSLWMSQLSKD